MIRKPIAFIITLLAICVFNGNSARAQDRAGDPTPTAPTATTTTTTADQHPAVETDEAQNATESLDLSITANVTASELSFEVVPDAKVEFTGKPARNTVWEAERRNLP